MESTGKRQDGIIINPDTIRTISAIEARGMLKNCKNELSIVMIDIENTARNGENKVHIYHSLSEKTILRLKELEYEIYVHSQITIQKDRLYYTIKF